MRRMKKQIVLVAAALSCTFMMTSGVKAATGTMTAKQAADEVNSQIASAKNITVDAYVGTVSDKNRISTVAVNRESKITYADYKAIGVPEMYKSGSKLYWHANDGKWYYTKSSSTEDLKTDDVITAKDKCSVTGVKKFNGKKCVVLNVTERRNNWNVKYYLDSSTKKLRGIETGTGKVKVTMTVNTSKKVKLSDKIKKATKKDFTENNMLAQGMNGVMCINSSETVKDVKITSYEELETYLKNIGEKNSNVKSVLAQYNKKYFKNKVLYVKSYKTAVPALGLFAVKNSKSSSGVNVTLTQYNVGAGDSSDAVSRYAVVVEMTKSAAKKINVKNVKIKLSNNTAYMPIG